MRRNGDGGRRGRRDQADDSRESGELAMGRRRKAKTNQQHINHERWLVSYADFITLLFAFFTTLYAISNVDAKKFSTMVQSMQVAFENHGFAGRVGDDALGPEGKAGHPTDMVMPPVLKGVGLGKDGGIGKEADLTQLKGELSRRLSHAIGLNQLDVEMDHRGLVISIREAGSFATGSAVMSPTAIELMAQIGTTLRAVGNTIRIEGHTDEIPIHTAQFKSNWELSTARATSVVAYLVESRSVEPSRMSAAGYAEFHPRVPNSSDGNRARNRRVDIVILNPTTRTAEEPSAHAGKAS